MFFEIEQIDLTHEGGTKEYHLLKIARSDGRNSIFVARWGKAGEWGQVQVVERGDVASVTKAFRQKKAAKLKRGYEEPSRSIISKVDTEAKLRLAIDEYLGAIRDDYSNLLVGMTWGPVPDTALLDDDVVIEADEPPRKPEPEIASTTADNPNWGMF